MAGRGGWGLSGSFVGLIACQLALACSTTEGRPDPSAVAGAGGGGAGEAAVTALDPGRKDMHRLSSTEYNATVRDLLGTTLQPASSSWRGGELAGFDNIASVLGVDEAQYGRYLEAARALATEVQASAELRARFAPCDLSQPDCVHAALATAGLRLFRRPLEPEELTTYQHVYDQARGLGDDEAASLSLALQALLASAEFLYRVELDPVPGSTEPHELGAYELASRLSYFLWSSAPDDALLQAAADGSLSQAGMLATQVDRMLDDPRSERLIGNFAGQWLGAREVASHPASSKFYQWSPALGFSAGREMVLYFGDFLRSERSWLEFPRADFNYVDGKLAYFYGMPTDASGSEVFERVEYHDDKRAGFFGLAGFLAVSSLDRRTSPSRRGRWIASKLLCAEPPPPPPNVPVLEGPPLDGAAGEASGLDVRQALERHRTEPTCAACHALFDPYGLALEEYDAIGLYRSTYDDGSAVDASAMLPPSTAYPDGLALRGLDGLARAVASDPNFGACLAKNLLTYGLGRVLTVNDEPHLQLAQRAWLDAEQTPSVRRLIHALISTEAFRLRRGGG